jgi:Leucine-rich repeat (LRR) protein
MEISTGRNQYETFDSWSDAQAYLDYIGKAEILHLTIYRCLPSIPKDFFSGFKSLKTLWFHDSLSLVLLEGMLSELTCLMNMGICDCQLVSLPEKIFSGLSSLQSLVINKIDDLRLSSGVFSGLQSLIILRLNDSNLHSLPRDLFSELPSLRNLYVDFNNFSSLPKGIFSGLRSLKFLSIIHNQLTSLPEGIFSDLESLECLDLRHNKLSEIPEGVFSGLTSLEWLGVKNNKLSSMPPGIPEKCKVLFDFQNPLLNKETRKLETGEMCLISYQPLEAGCEYRMCLNPIKSHIYLSEMWEHWEGTSGSKKCAMCKEWNIIHKIFINS